MSILQVSNLSKTYKNRLVVKDVSLKVETGQIVGLLGPNGAGKTTTFYMIVGLIPTDSGSILIDENNITMLPMHSRVKHKLGYLPQEASIFRRLTVYQNILAVLELRPELNKKQKQDKVESLLNEFNLQHIKNSLGQALSGGERRRVEIARALASDPKFILLDEPFAGVDPISVTDIKKIILDLQSRGLGVLITDHNVRETLDVCNIAYIVSEGKIIAQGSTNDILNNQTVKNVYLGEQFKL